MSESARQTGCSGENSVNAQGIARFQGTVRKNVPNGRASAFEPKPKWLRARVAYRRTALKRKAPMCVT